MNTSIDRAHWAALTKLPNAHSLTHPAKEKYHVGSH